ncbi:cold shock domain-containing protein [Vibrio cholerae]|nr:cold shock domain-containing protein [Vibrio cholerae]NAW84131.1 cold shock domain-containing protein [Vibrio sp. V43_P6S15P86]TNY81127.1 cold-shock protein [Vibrio parahaemolyticus]
MGNIMPIDKGYINAYIEHKGFGFIRREKGRDVLFTIDVLEDKYDTNNLQLKPEVEFDYEATDKGPRATAVRFVYES